MLLIVYLNVSMEYIYITNLVFIWPFLTYGLDKLKKEDVWKFTLFITHNFGK